MTVIPASPTATYQAYAQRAARGQLAASVASALAATATQMPAEMSRRDLHAALGKSLDVAA